MINLSYYLFDACVIFENISNLTLEIEDKLCEKPNNGEALPRFFSSRTFFLINAQSSIRRIHQSNVKKFREKSACSRYMLCARSRDRCGKLFSSLENFDANYPRQEENFPSYQDVCVCHTYIWICYTGNVWIKASPTCGSQHRLTSTWYGRN